MGQEYRNRLTEWEQLLLRLPEVLSAHVICSSSGEPTEIHVLADQRKSSKSLSRDIQSALSARFSREIDHQIISIAQIEPELLPAANPRAVLEGLTVRTERGAVEVEVHLSRGARSGIGVRRARSCARNRRRCLAEAALEAAEQCSSGGPKAPRFELVALELLESAGRRIVLTQVYSLNEQVTLLGSAFAEEEEDTAVVRSILHAINRKLEADGGVSKH